MATSCSSLNRWLLSQRVLPDKSSGWITLQRRTACHAWLELFLYHPRVVFAFLNDYGEAGWKIVEMIAATEQWVHPTTTLVCQSFVFQPVSYILRRWHPTFSYVQHTCAAYCLEKINMVIGYDWPISITLRGCMDVGLMVYEGSD